MPRAWQGVSAAHKWRSESLMLKPLGLNTRTLRYAFNITIDRPSDFGRVNHSHGPVSLLVAVGFRVGRGTGANAGTVTVGAVCAELLLQLAAALRGADSHCIVVAACTRRFQFLNARGILVRQRGIPVALSTTLAANARDHTVSVCGVCGSVIPVGGYGIMVTPFASRIAPHSLNCHSAWQQRKSRASANFAIRARADTENIKFVA